MQTEAFTMRISPKTKYKLFKLSQREERSQSDFIRWLIDREYFSTMEKPNQDPKPAQEQPAAVA